MLIKELIKELQNYDEDFEVGGVGHFGELLEIDHIYKEGSNVLIIIESAGIEPD